MFQEVTAEAETEINVDEPANAVDRLVELLPAARRGWGAFDSQVRAALRVAANGMRIAGRCKEAIALYEDLALPTEGNVSPNQLADYLEGTLGAAECRIPFGDLLPAAAARALVLEELPRVTGSRAQVLVERCHEVGIELDELGYEA